MSERKQVSGMAGPYYIINYGPDGEANYANLFTPEGVFVGNIRTHHAAEIVESFDNHAQATRLLAEKDNFIEALTGAIEHLERTRDEYRAEIERLTRERDEAYNNGYAARDGVVDACRSRAEAADAEVARLRGKYEPSSAP